MAWNPRQPPRHKCRLPAMNPTSPATEVKCGECGSDWTWTPDPVKRVSAAAPEPVIGRIVHIGDDGTQTDVTEGVQALYDLAVNSMDFQSGFWSFEDALPVAQIGRLCGFEQIDEIERYVREELRRREKAEAEAEDRDRDRVETDRWRRLKEWAP